MKLDLNSLKKIKLNTSKKNIKYLLIVFVIGIAIILFPEGNNSNNKKTIPNNNTNFNSEAKLNNENSSYEKDLEQKIEERFKKIEGVGEVEVLITLKSGNEIVVNKDVTSNISNTNEQDSEGGNRKSNNNDNSQSTVLISNTDGSEHPIIIKELKPEINGILIIAEGGGDIQVKNNLINAAKVILDVPVHKIEVMKMESKLGGEE